MKLAVSNIAWASEEESTMLLRLAHLGVAGIEVAPGQVSDVYRSGDLDAPRFLAWRRELGGVGLVPIALQGILAGLDRPVLRAETEEQRAGLLGRIKLAGEVAQLLQVGPMVFGNPGLRSGFDMENRIAFEQCADTLAAAAKALNGTGAWIALEPNAAIYGCNFGRTLAECARLVDHVGEGGLKLHVDLATAGLEEADLSGALRRHVGAVGHIHLSEPRLVRLGTTDMGPHRILASTLSAMIQAGAPVPEWLSIEMARPAGANSAEVAEGVEAAVRFARSAYADCLDQRH